MNFDTKLRGKPFTNRSFSNFVYDDSRQQLIKKRIYGIHGGLKNQKPNNQICHQLQMTIYQDEDSSEDIQNKTKVAVVQMNDKKAESPDHYIKRDSNINVVSKLVKCSNSPQSLKQRENIIDLTKRPNQTPAQQNIKVNANKMNTIYDKSKKNKIETQNALQQQLPFFQKDNDDLPGIKLKIEASNIENVSCDEPSSNGAQTTPLPDDEPVEEGLNSFINRVIRLGRRTNTFAQFDNEKNEAIAEKRNQRQNIFEPIKREENSFEKKLKRLQRPVGLNYSYVSPYQILKVEKKIGGNNNKSNNRKKAPATKNNKKNNVRNRSAESQKQNNRNASPRLRKTDHARKVLPDQNQQNDEKFANQVEQLRSENVDQKYKENIEKYFHNKKSRLSFSPPVKEDPEQKEKRKQEQILKKKLKNREREKKKRERKKQLAAMRKNIQNQKKQEKKAKKQRENEAKKQEQQKHKEETRKIEKELLQEQKRLEELEKVKRVKIQEAEEIKRMIKLKIIEFEKMEELERQVERKNKKQIQKEEQQKLYQATLKEKEKQIEQRRKQGEKKHQNVISQRDIKKKEGVETKIKKISLRKQPKRNQKKLTFKHQRSNIFKRQNAHKTVSNSSQSSLNHSSLNSSQRSISSQNSQREPSQINQVSISQVSIGMSRRQRANRRNKSNQSSIILSQRQADKVLKPAKKYPKEQDYLLSHEVLKHIEEQPFNDKLTRAFGENINRNVNFTLLSLDKTSMTIFAQTQTNNVLFQSVVANYKQLIIDCFSMKKGIELISENEKVITPVKHRWIMPGKKKFKIICKFKSKHDILLKIKIVF